MTNEKAKEILEQNGRKYTDAEVSAIKEFVKKMVLLQIEIEIEDKDASSHTNR